ncbi:MAG: coproporphyrinogen dehydrogenase HemZ [Clostridiales bacterium]|nr:coproporphyrinogen dehydrogenase HemZ [Clostridiales bacterium]
MIVSIMTPIPGFGNDLADVARVFFGNVQVQINLPGGDLTVTHTEQEESGARRCRITLEGRYAASAVRTAEVSADPLLEKRYHKRLIKQTLYDALIAATGRTPPWGSLTGIRPTRLLYEAMGRGLSLEEAEKETKEMFSVRGDKAALLREIVAVQQGMAQSTDTDADLYVGIPFCVSRCAYCSFLSGEVGKGKELPPYVEAVVKEIEATLALLEEKGLKPRAFYMGGGTPTALSAKQLEQVLSACRPFIRRAREVTVEAGRPDTIDREKLSVIREAGAGRISVNPQTMHDETLVRIGRRHTRAQTEQAYALAREAGFSHINMDLIAGLPGEDLDMFLQTLAWSRGLSPESLTVHTLSIKRSSLMHLWEAQLPDGGMVGDMVDAGRREAEMRGMRPYYLYRQKYMAGNLENVGYALPGHECLYNVDMMEETAHVFAVGAGAISKRVDVKKGRIERAPNVSDVGHYIARTDEMIRRKKDLWREEWT